MNQGIRWVESNSRCRCAECRERIEIGDRVALWTEVCVASYRPFSEVMRYIRLRRRYCSTCAALLQDSLTTSEAA